MSLGPLLLKCTLVVGESNITPIWLSFLNTSAEASIGNEYTTICLSKI